LAENTAQSSINESADFWRYDIGVNVIPADTKNRKAWHREDRKDLYFTFIDADKQNAMEELCTKNEKRITLHEMAQKFLVEQHKDSPEKAHIYMYSPIPFPQKSADSVLGLEVKGRYSFHNSSKRVKGNLPATVLVAVS
jgi:hypothetical protein